MTKNKFEIEYEIHCDVKRLYQYISSASGLEEWFANHVDYDEESKIFHFDWEKESHSARIANKRVNTHIKYHILPEQVEEIDEEEKDYPYIEFRVEHNEMTQTTFLSIIDYSEMQDNDDLKEFWDHQLERLHEAVGG